MSDSYWFAATALTERDRLRARIVELEADLAEMTAAIKQLMAVVGGCCIQAAGEPRCGECAWCRAYSLTREETTLRDEEPSVVEANDRSHRPRMLGDEDPGDGSW